MTEFFQSLGMSSEWAWLAATVSGVLLIAFPLMLAVAMIIYMDRKVLGAVMLRRGPNVVGPFGLLQSFADGLKVFLQETIIPSAANRYISSCANCDFHRGACRLGRYPVRRSYGSGRYKCRPALHSRD